MSIRNRIFWVAALISLILDRITKRWVLESFDYSNPPESWPIWQDVFHFTYVTNKGAAFSLFSENGDWLRWLSLIVSLLLIALACFGPRLQRWEQAGYGCILGGAMGNGIDRFVGGEVVDFLDFRLIQFPVFNLADVSINVGIICLLIAILHHPQDSPRKHKKSRSTPENLKKTQFPITGTGEAGEERE